MTQDVITSPIRKMKRDAVAGRYMSPLFRLLKHFITTRPKPAYGRQGLDWDRRARIHFGQVHFDPKNVTSLTGGSN